MFILQIQFLGTNLSLGIVSLRTLLRDDPPLNVLAVERQSTPGGIWTGHIPAYSTLQDLKIEYEVHGVRFPNAEPQRRAPRDEVKDWCEKYTKEFGLYDHILWEHDVVKVEQVKPMLFKVQIQPLPKGDDVRTVFSRSVVVCT